MRKGTSNGSSCATSIAPRLSQDEHSANLCTAKSRAPLTRFGIIKERVRCAVLAEMHPSARPQPTRLFIVM
eukprot:scaffold9009_cov130-Isochrysis_galbana.AAC.6